MVEFEVPADPPRPPVREIPTRHKRSSVKLVPDGGASAPAYAKAHHHGAAAGDEEMSVHLSMLSRVTAKRMAEGAVESMESQSGGVDWKASTKCLLEASQKGSYSRKSKRQSVTVAVGKVCPARFELATS